MKKRIVNYLTHLVTLSLIVGFGAWGAWYIYRIYVYEETNNAQVELYITPISSRVMGYVSAIRCTENELVRKGDTLLIIEDDEFRLANMKNEAMLNRAVAELKIAQKQIETNRIEQKQLESEIIISEIKLNNATKEFQRVKNLLAKESITQQQYDKIEADYLLAKKGVDIARYNYNESLLRTDELNSRVMVEQAKVNNCESELKNSQLNLTYTVIRAPYDGRVGKIDIQEGQLMLEGQVLTFITNEAAGKWIVANVKETQLASYTVGKEVTVTIDAIPDRIFKGRVESISPATGTRYSMMPPNNATGNFVRITQRVPVRIDLLDIDDVYDKLRGGMNAYVRSVKMSI